MKGEISRLNRRFDRLNEIPASHSLDSEIINDNTNSNVSRNNLFTPTRAVAASAGSKRQQAVDAVLFPTASTNTDTSTSGNTLYTADVKRREINTAYNNGMYVVTRFGYSSESLPNIETISPQLRKNILEGNDVNLASLLIPNHIPSNPTDSNYKPDPRLNRDLTMSEFVQAFGIYKSVMNEVFDRTIELDLYERDITDMGHRYNGKGFYEYHREFSAKAAAHPRVSNRKVDWSVQNNKLFCNIFANFTPNTCNHCNSVSHHTGFCPTLVENNFNNGNMRPYFTNAQNGNNSVNRYSYQPNNYKNDNQGNRANNKQFHLGKEICQNFNTEKGCYRYRCFFLHVCSSCKTEHSRAKCPASKNDGTGHNRQTNQVETAKSVKTPINMVKLEQLLEKHPDREFVSYLTNGLREGFNTGLNEVPKCSFECRNSLSAREQPDVVTALIEKEVNKGFLQGPFNSLPFAVYRVNAIGIAEGKYSKKKRLIVDLSSPHDNDDHTSIDNLINKE
ncbi:hypothetical protein SNE40_007858 [Patella caerulea]